MADVFLFPRLPASAARARLSDVLGNSVAELSRQAATSHPEAVFAATGGRRIGEDLLKKLRAALVGAAHQLGFPNDTRQESIVAFDLAAGRVLLAELPIAPGEASRDEFWSFMSLVLAPDLATWRFSDQNERRLLGGVRNTFQRLWWRAYLLCEPQEPDPWRLLRLPEDALVGLMERPSISSNPTVTRSIARGIADIAANVNGSAREEAWRDAYKRVRQRFPLVNLDVLPPAEVASQIDSICRAVMAAFVAKH